MPVLSPASLGFILSTLAAPAAVGDSRAPPPPPPSSTSEADDVSAADGKRRLPPPAGIFSRDELPPPRPYRWMLGAGISFTAVGVLLASISPVGFSDSDNGLGIGLVTVGTLHVLGGVGLLIAWGIMRDHYHGWVWKRVAVSPRVHVTSRDGLRLGLALRF